MNCFKYGAIDVVFKTLVFFHAIYEFNIDNDGVENVPTTEKKDFQLSRNHPS